MDAQMLKEHYCNPLFDTQLLFGGAIPSGLSRLAEELPYHYLFAAGPNDTLILPGELSEHFLDYASQLALPLPAVSRAPVDRNGARFEPYAWTPETVRMNSLYAATGPAPDLEVVARVNSKRFSRELELSLGENRRESWWISNEGDLNRILSSAPGRNWILKAEHGNAASANRILLPGEDPPWPWLREILGYGKGLILEPWHSRFLDIGTNFELKSDGTVSDRWRHLSLCSERGSFHGVRISASPLIAKHQESLDATVDRVAGALHKEGYFGPVGIDSYLWADEAGEIRLRALVEINARKTFAAPAYGLWKNWTEKQPLCWRLYNREKLIPRLQVEEAGEFFQEFHRSGAEQSVALTSPMCFMRGGEKIPMKKIGILFRAPPGKLDEMMKSFEKECHRPFAC